MRQRKDSDQSLKKRIIKLFNNALIILFLAFCAITIMEWSIEDDGTWKPDYPKTGLGSIVSKAELTEEDYQMIFMQTGLGRDAADELLLKEEGKNRVRVFEKYQDNFFAAGNYECRLIAVIVSEERMRDKDGNTVKGFEVPNLKNGDILITKATHSLGWRHGHAAIVTDAAKGETLEAILLGNPSILQNVSKWRTYPSFIQLRLKDWEKGDPEKIAEYAKEEVLGIQYGLLTGIPFKASKEIKQTQCAHLVWYPFEHFGYNLDSDGSWLVTPKDIANSDLLEVVQVYGVNPEEIWP